MEELEGKETHKGWRLFLLQTREKIDENNHHHGHQNTDSQQASDRGNKRKRVDSRRRGGCCGCHAFVTCLESLRGVPLFLQATS